MLRVLDARGYTQPTPIQEKSIPALLEGTDVLGLAQTGTGKTAAFGLPTLQTLAETSRKRRAKTPRALVLAPTRELAAQIFEELGKFADGTDMRLACIYGGVGQNPQVRAISRGLDVLIATPGRLLDLVNQRHCDLREVEILILDEADRLLDMGFVRDVRKIVAMTPKTRQSLLFSATMPKEVDQLAAEILNQPIRVDVSPKEISVRKIDQRVVMVPNPKKRAVLETLLRDDAVRRAIVFHRTKHGANRLCRQLVASGIGAEVIHGNKSQNARNKALAAFKNGDAWVLVATDIAARGIDIDGITHVFNYELPHEPESYVHRVGRTGRAGAEGAAFALVDPTESKRLRAIERLIGFAPKRVKVEGVPDDLPEVDEERPSRQQRQRRPGPKTGNRSGGGNGGNGQSGNASGAPKRRRRRRKPVAA